VNKTSLISITSIELEAVHGGAHYNCADTTGHVPEIYGHYGTRGGWYGNTEVLSRHPCRRLIRYNLDTMKNAGPHDWAKVQNHERAHARGLDHWQGSPASNPAYYPRGNLTGR
jgi:hypothetical protein